MLIRSRSYLPLGWLTLGVCSSCGGGYSPAAPSTQSREEGLPVEPLLHTGGRRPVCTGMKIAGWVVVMG